ncbi:MAG TPA: hypothetical protein VGS10_05505 [Terracidiphilus sp.]|nr:hypothetical protein [Terracidiphilus sp.]
MKAIDSFESSFFRAINAQEICFAEGSAGNIADWRMHLALVCARMLLLQSPPRRENDADESA